MEIIKIKKIIEKTLNQNKAKNIIAISLRGKSSIADYMIILLDTYSLYPKVQLKNQGKMVSVNLKLREKQAKNGN